jgi:1,4-alpha-glucan branching enzyme
LPISHDEVVHLKKSLIEKCPGNYNEKFAGVRLFMTYMMTHPGKKLLFMGSEFGQFNEWNEQKELDWSCLGYERHQQLKYYIEKLNRLYKNCRALYDDTLYWQGFSWIAANDASANVFIYERCYEEEKIIVILNFAFKSWYKYQFKAKNGRYKIILCSQDNKYGGNLSLEDDIIDVKNNIMEMDIPACCGIIIKKEN